MSNQQITFSDLTDILTLIQCSGCVIVADFSFRDLSSTSIETLPTSGLKSVEELTIEDVPSLKLFPPVLRFSSIRVARLTYPYHCCAFSHPEKQDEQFYHQMSKELACSQTTLAATPTSPSPGNPPTEPYMSEGHFHADPSYIKPRFPRWLGSTLEGLQRTLSYYNNAHQPGEHAGSVRRENEERYRRSSEYFGHFSNGGWGSPVPNDTIGPVLPPIDSSGTNGQWHTSTINSEQHISDVTCGQLVENVKRTECTPKPDAFNPCEDVMGYVWLRVVVWFVVSTALVGNFIVLGVTISSRYKLTVAKFLMCNLSMADLCLGGYLLILAAYDIHTKGVYFGYAILWQLHGGCQVAGFLSTFSICLSIFTLTVITLERWYAISHAINLIKRLRLRQATTIMFCGWVYALIMATLPLVGVSRYGKTSLCLPMETKKIVDKAYVLTLLVTNALAFIVICSCYIDMYRQVTNPANTTAAGRNDANIAKRMAVLVFTDFACLFPIAFFGLTAACGKPLITVTQSKILLVFFLPLNSCANPFLYAIFTKQFKKDLFGMFGRCGLCLHNAVQYRTVYVRNPASNSASRASHRSGNRMSVPSILSSLFSNEHRGSKPSLVGSPKITPQTSPKLKRLLSHVTPTENGVWHPVVPPSNVGLAPNTPNAPQDVASRKLSIVLEANQTCDDIHGEFHRSDESSKETKEDLVEGRPRPIRSVSGYSAGHMGLQKMGSFDYDKLDWRKGSGQTSITSSTDLSTDVSILSDNSLMENRPVLEEPIPESDLEHHFPDSPTEINDCRSSTVSSDDLADDVIEIQPDDATNVGGEDQNGNEAHIYEMVHPKHPCGKDHYHSMTMEHADEADASMLSLLNKL